MREAIIMQSACNQHAISMQSGSRIWSRLRRSPDEGGNHQAISMQSACNQHAIRVEDLEPPPPLTLGCCGRRGARDRSARLMREAISGHQRSSEVISGHQRSSEAHQRPISAHQRSSAVISAPLPRRPFGASPRADGYARSRMPRSPAAGAAAARPPPHGPPVGKRVVAS